MASSSRKRDYSEVSRSFNEKWTDLYFFVESNGKPVCLICGEAMSAINEYNLKRHYDTKHAAMYASLQGQTRTDKQNRLRKSLITQQSIFKKVATEADDCVKASYVIAQKIAKKSKPFSDGEFVKECLVSAAECVCPKNIDNFKNVSLSRATVTRRVEELAMNVEETLRTKLHTCMFYSLALDESTDQTDTALLAVFVRGIDQKFHIFEELLALCPLKGRTRGTDILEALKTALIRYGLSLKNLAGVATDGAPSMVGKKAGVVALLKEEEGVDSERFTSYHCKIHQENLCAKSLRFEQVMRVITDIVNFIRARGLNHRQFQNFLRTEWEAEYGDVVYYSDVRWLSRSKVLTRIFELRDAIKSFMTEKRKPVPEFNDPK